MSNTSPFLIFIIPALNEEQTVGVVVSSLKKYGDIVLIDDGSLDSTAQIARDSGAQVISHKTRAGYDAAIITGFNYALSRNYQWAITVDADGQHATSNITYFLEAIEGSSNIDLLLGVREIFPRIGERIMSLFFKIIWGVSDPLCGLKGYRLDFCKKNAIKICKTFDSIGTEIMLNYLTHHAITLEMKVKINDRRDTPRFGSAWRVNVRILKSMTNITKKFLYKSAQK